jgi:putative membrane protein
MEHPVSLKKRLSFLALALAGVASAGYLHAQNHAAGSQASTPGAADQSFLRKAASDGATEVALGQLAMQHAQSGPTKEMAQHLVTDHRRANDELTGIATRKHVEVSARPDAEALAKEKSWGSGASYDQAYAQAMVKDHRDAVSLFTKATESKDPVIRQFAQTTLPVLKQHLSMAEALAKGDETHTSTSPGAAHP